MKYQFILAAVLCTLAAVQAVDDNPIEKIVSLLADLKSEIEADGVAEQASYDKFSCWCENTMSEKSASITATKDTIEETQTNVIRNKGDLGAHGADIKQLKKDIAANIEAQREATEVRDKEQKEYSEEKSETEQCIGALESAINALAGAGTGKGFLETMKEAQLLSVVAGVKSVLHNPRTSALPEKELQVVKEFVSRPDQFIGGRTGAMSAAQIAQNPFGDYSPQSTQIQGILKSMYASFTADLENANVDEAGKEKAYRELMATKQEELQTLEASLESTTMTEAEKQKSVAESKKLLDELKTQLEADEKFFVSSKDACMMKAQEWATRTRLRTEELNALADAIRILDSDKAKEIFANATSTFLQTASYNVETPAKRAKAYKKLQKVATQTHSMSLAKVAVALKTGGHFDAVIAQIDNIITLLREEEQSDIQARDSCEGKQNNNANTIEDLNHAISKAEAEIERLTDEQAVLEGKVAALDEQINATRDSIEEAKTVRESERQAFLGGQKADAQAIELLERAIAALDKYYKEGGTKGKFIQLHSAGVAAAPAGASPQYSDAPPKTSWRGEYGSHDEHGAGVIGILDMLKEDLENEMKVANQEETDAVTAYIANRNELQASLESQIASRAAMNAKVADVVAKISDQNELKEQKNGDLTGQEGVKAALETDCAWVATHFESRRTKRKAELDALNDAKSFLAGGGEDDLGA